MNIKQPIQNKMKTLHSKINIKQNKQKQSKGTQNRSQRLDQKQNTSKQHKLHTKGIALINAKEIT